MQQIIKGEHSILRAGDEIRNRGYDAVCLYTGKHFLKETGTAFLKELDSRHFIKQGINVTEEEIIEAVAEFKKEPGRAILAIGGGSVIDLAKAVIYRCVAESIPVPWFIAAPTTAGSGSEATQFAVVYNKKKKESLVHPSLLPALVFLDPALTYSLSPYQTAISGMDALAQAVESYWNKNATDESKQYASEAIAGWRTYFLPAVNDQDKLARAGMLEAAHLAGKAINITRTTGPHALSYYLTANHDIPHGQAVALFLPLFFLYNDPPDELYAMLGVKDAVAAKEFIQTIMKQAGLVTTLQELGIDKKTILPNLLNEVNEERFANNPAIFDKKKLEDLVLLHL